MRERLILLARHTSRLHLPHFAANHLVASARIAGDVDAADIDAATRIDEDGERDLALLLVDLRLRH